MNREAKARRTLLLVGRLLSLAVALSLVTGCMRPRGASVRQKRASVGQMSEEALAEFYKVDPKLRSKVNGAPGYAVFSNFGLKVMVVGTGNGYGSVVDRKSGKRTYMRMIEVGGGFGFGARNYRVLFVFHDRSTLQNFIDRGLEIGGQAEAVAKYEDEGGGLSLIVATRPGMDVYQLTKTGASATAMLAGTRYYKDDELN